MNCRESLNNQKGFSMDELSGILEGCRRAKKRHFENSSPSSYLNTSKFEHLNFWKSGRSSVKVDNIGPLFRTLPTKINYAFNNSRILGNHCTICIKLSTSQC